MKGIIQSHETEAYLSAKLVRASNEPTSTLFSLVPSKLIKVCKIKKEKSWKC